MNTKSKRAFITGVYGQDGSYLAEYLLELGYEVLGLIRENEWSSPNAALLSGKKKFSACVGDLTSISSFVRELDEFAPDEVYNLAAISDLKTARENPGLTRDINFIAFQNLVAHITTHNPQIRVFQALSSRILLPDNRGVITERSALSESKNAYDEAKRDSYEKVVLEYRKRGFFITSGFLCNHESPRRDERFVTGKIARSVAQIACGGEEKMFVGNIEAMRDWSFAGDVVRAIQAVLQVDKPHDYVIGSGELHSVKEFIEIAFQAVNKNITWVGIGVDTKGFDEEGILRVEISPEFYQPDDNPVVGDISFIEAVTGWKQSVTFTALVEMMVNAEVGKH